MADRPTEVRYVDIDITSTGPVVVQLVVGEVGYDVLLINGSFVVDTAMDVSFEDGDATNRLGPYPLGAEGGVVLPNSNVGHCRTGSGQAFSIRLAGIGVQTTVSIGGGIAYRLVPTGMEIG